MERKRKTGMWWGGYLLTYFWEIFLRNFFFGGGVEKFSRKAGLKVFGGVEKVSWGG